jgi:hypothetical protein
VTWFLHVDLWLEPFEFKVEYGGSIHNDQFELLTWLALWFGLC